MATETHKGRRIEIGAEGDVPSLTIDGSRVQITRLADGHFASSWIPYSNFPSVLELARALVDGGLV